MDFLKYTWYGGGLWFSIRFAFLLLYSVSNFTVEKVRGCMSLKKYVRGSVNFEKIKISQGKAVL